MHDHSHTVQTIAGWGVLAGMGSAAKYVAMVMKSKEKISNRRFLLMLAGSMLIGCFCGAMGGLLTSAMEFSSLWQWTVAGGLGWAGPQGMDAVLQILKTKIEPSKA